MKALRESGAEPYGLDPTVGDEVIELDGFKIAPSFEKMDRDVLSAKLDLVSMNFVLEHVAYPWLVLDEISKHMRKGGMLLAEVPWDFNLAQMERWDGVSVPRWVSTPDHVNYFNPRSLRILLHRAGFEAIVTRSTYPVETFLEHGLDFNADKPAREKMLRERSVRQKIWWALGQSAELSTSGRTVWILAVKR